MTWRRSNGPTIWPTRPTAGRCASRGTRIFPTRSRWRSSWRGWGWTATASAPRSSTTWSRTPTSRWTRCRKDFGHDVAVMVRRGHQAGQDALLHPGGAAGGKHPQDAAGHGRGHPGHHHQAGRPAAQHAHHASTMTPRSSGTSRHGDDGGLRAASPTGSASAAVKEELEDISLQIPGPGCLQGNRGRAGTCSKSEREEFIARTSRSGSASRLRRCRHEALHVRAGSRASTASTARCICRAGPSTRSTTSTPCGSSWTPSTTATTCWASSTICSARCPTGLRTISPPPRPTCTSRCTPPSSSKEGIPFEVQIRTWEMHYTAEYGIAAHWKYKLGIQRQGQAGGAAGLGAPAASKASRTRSDAEDIVRTIKTDLVLGGRVRLHPQGGCHHPAGRLHRHRLRLRHPHRGRQPDDRRQGGRADRAAFLRAEDRRDRRDS